MAASSSDYFKKVARRWVGQIGAGAVADGVVTTIPLSSTTNLPTGTGVVAVIDRVDSNGTSTTSLEETILGVVSGSNLVTCTRGAEGTAQAHSAGAVVEILLTAKGWNDLVDGLLIQHDQTGLHTNITACNVTASGTNYGKFVTGSTVTASDVTATRAMSASTVTASDVVATRGITGRPVKRVYSTTTLTTLTPEISTYDIFHLTALASALTIANHSTSTPADGDMMLIRLLDNATPRALTFDTAYVAKAGTALPTTTTASKNLSMLFQYNSNLTKWNLLSSGLEA